jgi:hypothetical protein
MSRVIKFNKHYFLLTVLLFGIEIIIAKYFHDPIIRPYIGDLLVVILIYCFIKSFLNTPIFATAISVLVFAFTIELLQYFHIVDKLHLQNYPIARIVIGTSFEWIDLIAYTVGIIFVLYIEKVIEKRNKKVVHS